MSATPAPSTTYSVKRKRLPEWATPGLVVGVIGGIAVVALVAVALVVETEPRFLPATVIFFAVSMPVMAFTGYRILFGEARSATPKTRLGGGFRRLLLYRVFFGSWMLFVVGFVSYLKYIKVV